ncbi:MAG TPA: MlaD family protein [Vicinamibacterales bacterium]|nr:MlaD family protein [Vicinamibacterales bacterium]
MPRTRSLAWSELKLGALTIVAVAIAAVLIFSLTGTKGFAWQRYSLKTRFSNVAGLASGSPVRIAGVEVGTVTDVQLVGSEVEVTFQVNEKNKPLITDRSVARLGSVSLLGQSAVDITPSQEGTPIEPWGYVRQGKAAAALSDVTDSASQGISELTAMIHDLRQGRGTAGKLLTDEQLYAELNRFVASAGALTDGLKQGRGTLGKLLNDPATANALEASLQNIEAVTRQIASGEGSLGRLMKDDAFARSLTSATGNMDTLMAKLNSSEGTAGRLINDPALFNRLNSVTERLDTLVTRLNDGEGTAGQLLKDKQLYENMNGAVGDLRSLVADIRKDPRKFLNIKVSVF